MITEAEKIEKLVDKFDNAMLVTRNAQGELRSRPMAIAEHGEGGEIFFVTSINSGKIEEVMREPHVNIAFQKSSTYLSLSGRAQIIDDQDVIDEIWKPSMNIWFRHGKDSSDVVVLKVHATEGEYWDMELGDRLAFLVKAGKALLGGEKVESDDFAHHGKAQL